MTARPKEIPRLADREGRAERRGTPEARAHRELQEMPARRVLQEPRVALELQALAGAAEAQVLVERRERVELRERQDLEAPRDRAARRATLGRAAQQVREALQGRVEPLEPPVLAGQPARAEPAEQAERQLPAAAQGPAERAVLLASVATGAWVLVKPVMTTTPWVETAAARHVRSKRGLLAMARPVFVLRNVVTAHNWAWKGVTTAIQSTAMGARRPVFKRAGSLVRAAPRNVSRSAATG